jgi:hypothetical protein
VRRAFSALSLFAFASLVSASGCSKSSDVAPTPRDEPRAAPASLGSNTPAATPALSQAPLGASTVNVAPLPEDPEAGKRSEAQWQEHLEEEEEGRQNGFDRRRLKQHRALIGRIKAVRAQVARAPSLSALGKTQSELPARIALLRQGVQQIDPWGVTSRLLPDYKAVVDLLESSYCEAKAEALRGNPAALAAANRSLDEHFEAFEEKLEHAAESEDEY